MGQARKGGGPGESATDVVGLEGNIAVLEERGADGGRALLSARPVDDPARELDSGGVAVVAAEEVHGGAEHEAIIYVVSIRSHKTAQPAVVRGQGRERGGREGGRRPSASSRGSSDLRQSAK
jgi:hypothetical protein